MFSSPCIYPFDSVADCPQSWDLANLSADSSLFNVFIINNLLQILTHESESTLIIYPMGYVVKCYFSRVVTKNPFSFDSVCLYVWKLRIKEFRYIKKA